MKELKINLKPTGLARKVLKAWTIGTVISAVINSPRNRIVDVLLGLVLFNLLHPTPG